MSGEPLIAEGRIVNAKMEALVPMAFVADVSRSITFYEQLGFSAGNTFAASGSEVPTWAWLESGRASLMLARASRPVVSEQQTILFYLYCEDVATAREALLARGVAAGEIAHPFYAPGGEFRVTDPDGYVLMITHTAS